jgi:hypothetical protein
MDPTNVLATQGVAVLLIPILVQWMKNSGWRLFNWIDPSSSKVNRTVSWLLGIVTAAGIHMHADAVGNGTYMLVVNGLTWHSALVVIGQLGGQQFVYNHIKTLELLETYLSQGAKAPPPPGKAA